MTTTDYPALHRHLVGTIGQLHQELPCGCRKLDRARDLPVRVGGVGAGGGAATALTAILGACRSERLGPLHASSDSTTPSKPP
jgi:hypothetical protein